MKLLAVPYLLLLSALCLSPSDRSIGVNGFAVPRLSHACTRSIGCHDSRLWMTTSSSSNALDNSDENDADLPKLKNKLTREFFSIGFPAFIQLAAEPLAALVVSSSIANLRMLIVSCPQNPSSSFFLPSFPSSAFLSNRIRRTSVALAQRFWVVLELQSRPSMLFQNFTMTHF